MQKKNGLFLPYTGALLKNFCLFMGAFCLSLGFLVGQILQPPPLLLGDPVIPAGGIYYINVGDMIVFDIALAPTINQCDPPCYGCAADDGLNDIYLSMGNYQSSGWVPDVFSPVIPGIYPISGWAVYTETSCSTLTPNQNHLETSNSVEVQVADANTVPTINISNASGTSLCAGSTITFLTTNTYSGYTPSYQWKKNGVVIAGATTSTYTSSTLVVGDVITCEMVSSMAILTNPVALSNSVTITTPLTPSVSISSNPVTGTTLCPNTNVVFTASPTNAGYNPIYVWKKNGVAYLNSNSPVYTIASNSLQTGDNITCELTPNIGCFASMATVSSNPLTMNTITPIAITTLNNTPVCMGGTLTLTTNISSSGGCTVTWQNKINNIWTTIAGATTTTYTPPAFSAAGFYYYRVKRDCGSCKDSADFTISVAQNPSIPTILINGNYYSSSYVCPGGTATLSTHLYSPINIIYYNQYYYFQWQQSPDSITWNNISNANTNQYISPPVVAGSITYYRVVTTPLNPLANCVTTISNVIALKAVVNYTYTLIPNFPSICTGGTVSITASAISGNRPAYYYTWQVLTGSTWTAIPGYINTTDTTYTSPILTSTTHYQVICYDVCGVGISYTPILTITVNPDPTVTITSPVTSVCVGQSTTLTANLPSGFGTGIYQWQYFQASLWTSIAGATSDTYTTPALTASASYRVLVTTSISGCNTIANKTIGIKALPNIQKTPANPSLCAGGSVSIVASGGTSYSWSPATNLSATTGATVTANPSISTTYTLTGTASNGCAVSIPVPVNVISAPGYTSVAITSDKGDSICPNTPVVFSPQFTPSANNNPTAFQYEWKLNGAVAATTATYSTSTLNNGDIIDLKVSASLACQTLTPLNANPFSMSVLNNPIAPSLTISTPNGICPQSISWQKSLGGTVSDMGTAIQRTSDGGYIVAGTTSSVNGDVTGNHGLSDIWVVKLDSTGTIQWQKSLGGTNNESTNSIQQTLDGGYIVGGYTASNDGDVTGNHGGNDAWVVKLDALGTIQWQKTYGSTIHEQINRIKQTSDGGYVFTAYIGSNPYINSYGTHSWVVKLDSLGTLQWQQNYSLGYYDHANSIQQTTDGGYLLNCYAYVGSYNAGGHVHKVRKLDANGVIVWDKDMVYTGPGRINAIKQTSDGGYIVTGYTDNSNNIGSLVNHGARDYWVVKLSTTGIVQWEKTYGGTSSEQANSIQQTVDGGYIVAGYTQSNNGDAIGNDGLADFWVVKLDVIGMIQWQKSYGGTDVEFANSIEQTPDGGFIVAGYASSANGDVTGNHGHFDFWVVKLESPIQGTCAPSNAAICILSPVVFTATAANPGISPFTYNWKKNGAVVASTTSNATTNTYSFAAGTLAANDLITCEMLSNMVCLSPTTTLSNTISVTVNTPQTGSIVISASPATPICAGQTVSFTATLTNSTYILPTYQWKKNGVAIVGATAATYSDNTLNNNDIITCDLITNNICSPTISSNSQVVNIIPSPSLSTSTPSICTGGTAQLSITGGMAGSTYSWQAFNTSSNSWLAINLPGYTGGTNTSFSPTLVASQQYRVIYTTPCGSGTMPVVNITVIPDPTVTITSSSSNLCVGTNTTLTATLNGGVGTATYQWQENVAGVYNTIPGATSNVYTTAALSTSGNKYYKVIPTMTGAGCNLSGTGIISLAVKALPNVATSPASPTYCVGGSISIAASGGTSYSWSPATNLSATTGTPVLANPTSSTTYTLTGTGSNGCSKTISVPVTVKADPSISISGNSTACLGTTMTFTATSAGGAGTCTIVWQKSINGTSWTNIAGATGATYTTPALSANAYYRATYSCTGGGCSPASVSNSINVTLISPIATVLSATNSTICTGGTASLSVNTGLAGTTYSWQQSTNGGTSWTNISGYLGTTNTSYTSAALTTSTAYRVIGISACKRDTTTAVTISVVPDPALTVSTSGNNFCIGNNPLLTATLTNGTGTATYQWQQSISGVYTNIAGATNATYTPNVLTAGNNYYKVLASMSGAGCGVTGTGIISLTAKALPNVATSPTSPTYCIGGSQSIAASGASSYTWSPATNLSATTGTPVIANPQATTSYTLTGTGTNGCSKTISVPVTVTADPSVSISGPSSVPTGTNATLTASVTGGSGTCTRQWQSSTNGTTWANISGATGASYTTPAITGTKYYRASYNCTASGCSPIAYSNVLTIIGVQPPARMEMPNNELSLSLFPNPADVQITVHLDMTIDANTEFAINNLLGEEVIKWQGQSENGSYEQEISIENLASGVYFLTAKIEGRTMIQKFVKE